ncbi:MAG: Kdo2-lipid lauroyltransferase/acyltransferase [Desulfonauticus sp.]|jgi:KDO2-lipid IV(A) lauroyltransferase|nr:Kdo2-lipid lauroyltransferase/acyltransferase [Desulfonauticus sp.]
MENLSVNFIKYIAKKISTDSYQIYGEKIGILLWNLLSSRRKYAIESIIKHLNFNYNKALSIAKKSFIHTGISYFESLMLENVDYRFIKEKVKIKNEENLEKISKSKRPAVVVTGHLGSWELLLKVLRYYLPEKKSQIVVKFSKNKFLANLIGELRESKNIEIVGHRLVTHKIFPQLKRGGLAAFLVDHNCLRKEAIFLPFLNEIAAVNMGPALIALRTRALVWPTFLVRNREGFEFYLENPLDTQNLQGTLKDKVKDIASFYTQAVEKKVYSFPEQWYWLHRRWKTRP